MCPDWLEETVKGLNARFWVMEVRNVANGTFFFVQGHGELKLVINKDKLGRPKAARCSLEVHVARGSFLNHGKIAFSYVPVSQYKNLQFE